MEERERSRQEKGRAIAKLADLRIAPVKIAEILEVDVEVVRNAQEAKEEGREMERDRQWQITRRAIPRLAKLGITPAKIADVLELDLAIVQKTLDEAMETKAPFFLVDDIRKTRIWQEAWLEGFKEGFEKERGDSRGAWKLHAIPKLTTEYFPVEAISSFLDLDVNVVRRALAKKKPSRS